MCYGYNNNNSGHLTDKREHTALFKIKKNGFILYGGGGGGGGGGERQNLKSIVVLLVEVSFYRSIDRHDSLL